jgi:hypothetical protein
VALWLTQPVRRRARLLALHAVTQLATSDEERLNWYECFSAYPVDGEFSLDSVAQYDFVYDYYRDSLTVPLGQDFYALD